MKFRTALAAAVTLLAIHANAQNYQVGQLRITHPHARATVAHQSAGSAYLTIENTGKLADRLTGAASSIAGSVEMHSMSMDGNVMKMREVDAIALPPLSKASLEPGGAYHLMLVGLRQPLKAGDRFPLTLSFEKAGRQEVSVIVDGKEPAKTSSQHMH